MECYAVHQTQDLIRPFRLKELHGHSYVLNLPPVRDKRGVAMVFKSSGKMCFSFGKKDIEKYNKIVNFKAQIKLLTKLF